MVTNRLRYCFEIQKGKVPNVLFEERVPRSLPYLSMDYIRTGIVSSYAREGIQVEASSCCLLWDGANAGEVFINKDEGYLSSTSAVLRPKQNIEKGMAAWYLSYFEDILRFHTNGMGIPHVDSEILKNLSVPLFELDRQRAIAAFLNDRVSSIDKLISKEGDVITSLIAYKTRHFTEALRSTLNYKKTRLNTLAWLTKGPFGSDMKKELFVEKGNNTKKVYIQENCLSQDETIGDYYITQTYYHQMSRFAVVPHDVLITCDGTLGRFVELSDECEGGVISSSLLKVRIHSSQLTHKFFEYYWEYLLLPDLLKETRNSALVHLPSASLIGKMLINLPSVEEQNALTLYLDKKCEAIDRLITLKQEKIEKLKEYKKSLIYECVTGRREV